MTDQPVATTRARKSLVAKFANNYGLEPDKMMSTLKSTAFRQKGRNAVEITNEQMAALVIVADQYNLNPFTKEIYAYPDQGGIVPVVGVDGWARIINEHPEFDGLEFNYSTEKVENAEHKTAPEWIEVVIHRKDRSQPTTVREYFDEVYRPPFKQGSKGPWQTHTRRMMRHKVLIQGARVAFGFTGIHDQDEAERIIESDYIDVTPTAAPQGASQTDRIKSTLGITEATDAPEGDTEAEPEPEAEPQCDPETGEVLPDELQD